MRPITDEFLLNMAAVSATVIGLFAVGILFFAESGFRRLQRAGREVEPYMRAGTRIVFVLFAFSLLLPLTLVALEPIWSVGFFSILSVLLIAANIDTAIRIRTVTRAIRSPSLLVNEILGTPGSVAIVVLPWALGGLSPTREDLTWSILIAFGTAFMSVGATVLFVLDIVKFEPIAKDRAEQVEPKTMTRQAQAEPLPIDRTAQIKPAAARTEQPEPAPERTDPTAPIARPARRRASTNRAGTEQRPAQRGG